MKTSVPILPIADVNRTLLTSCLTTLGFCWNYQSYSTKNLFLTFRVCTLQLYVDAYDALRPYNKATLMITITVLRNEGAPQWTFNVDNVNIREDKEPYTNVTTVSAVDPLDGVGYTSMFFPLSNIYRCC